jgi:hypothetical protein
MKKHRRPRRITGAGDLIAMIAQPIAAVIDAAAGTNLKGCQSCQSRRKWLNARFPV